MLKFLRRITLKKAYSLLAVALLLGLANCDKKQEEVPVETVEQPVVDTAAPAPEASTATEAASADAAVAADATASAEPVAETTTEPAQS